MKCSNCYAILVSTYRCRYCPNHFCSLSCLDYHCSKHHPENNITMTNIPQINSPYLIYGIINNSIIYDSFYSLKNFVPIYDEYGKVKIIGSGSYGQVYLALHTVNKKYYAIKHMDKKKLFSLLHSLSSIQKEIDIQSKIDHPNIVKLLFVKETNISYDLIMEYASDGSLFHYIRKFKGLNENKTFSLFIQVVNAVNFLHQNDLIHRDIKPENILMYENNVVRLCDFGWCVKLDGHQRGTFCGTTEYMSPELVNHEGYGKEIDVWSLGVLLYEMIHGYSPFRPNKPKFNEKDVMDNIKNHNLIFGRRVSDECKSLIYHLLDPNINKRYKVEDIYNSDFVKKYEMMHYNYPDNNLVMKYNKYLKQNNNNNANNNNINEKNENIDISNMNNINSDNNIIYSKFEPEIGEKTNDIIASIDNILYSNNNHIEENKNNIYNNYFESNNNNHRNLSPTPLNRGIYSHFLNSLDNNYSQIYNENINNNYINNDIHVYIENNNHNHRNNKDNKLLANKTIDNYYSINVDKNNEKNIIELYSAHNNDAFNEEIKRDNKQFINFNNNKYLIFSGQNEDNKNDNNINQISNNNNDIWDIQNNIQPVNNINNIIETQSQYINIEEPQKNINTEEIANKLISNINNNNNNNGQNIDNNVNYNYYYNFNNYNNNYTNNFFNNSYSPLTNPVNFTKKISSTNNSLNNNNSISINNNYILDKNKTPSTIPTTSNKNIQDNKIQNMRENIIVNKNNNIIINEKKSRKVSEFEIGEDISDKEQNESESVTIKINVNKEQQKINNRKYLSKSDYLIINKRKKEMQKNLENKRMNNNYTVNNTFSSNNNKNWRNYNRMINKTDDIINLKHSSIQNKISSIDIKKILKEENDNKKKNTGREEKMKILDENKDNIKIHEIKMVNMSMNPSINKEVQNYPKNSIKKMNANKNNIITKQIKSKSYSGKNSNNIIVEINETNKESNNIKSNDNKKVMDRIFKEKKDYIKMIKEGNSNMKNKNVIIIKKENDDSKGNNSIGDVLCSIFHAFDSKHEVHEINVVKKEDNKKINNKNSKDELNQKNISFIEINGKKNQRKGNNKIEIDVNKGKGLTPNLTSNKSSFIRITHNNNCNTQTHNSPKVMNLGNSRLRLENSHSTTNINKHFKLNNQTNTQPNSFVKSVLNINSKYNTNTNSNTTINSNLYNELKKDVRQYQKILKPSTSSSNINYKNERLKLHLTDKIENNKNYLIKEIPINVRNRNKINKSDANIDNFNDLCDSKLITPKKGNIFNRINPIKLLGAFKKELNNISRRERALYSKEKKEKK